MQGKNIDSREAVALYIHIPFCKKKCFYCDFLSYSGKEKLMINYTKALAKDIESIGDRKIKTIFIGGGTPTYLSLQSWNNIYEALKKINVEDNLEFTVEGNPGTFTEEKFKVLRKMGVNRLSIGLQAWQDSILKCIGRIHTLEDFLKTYEMAREFGFSNINIDLMFGLPDQTIKNWKESLQNVVELNPEHISCYSLIVEKGTPFYDAHVSGSLNLPGEEEERQMYYFALDFLPKMGYEQYEISNFSKKNRRCEHNLIYWNLEEYIGCGAGAHSYVDGYRYRNTKNIEEYILQENLNQFLKLDKHENSLCDNMEEFVFMGLRKIDGISTEDFYRRFNRDIYSIYGNVIEKYINMGILIKEGHMLYLSKRGIEVSNSVMCDFILT